MAAETITTLDGFFKIRYADKLEDLVPDFNDFAGVIPFKSRPKLGKQINFPARVKRAQGFTFAAGGDDFTINAAVPGKTVEATASQYSYVMRDRISYDVAAAATSSEDAFGDAVDEIVRDMTNSMAFHRELSIFYGQKAIALFAEAGTSATSNTLTLTKASSAIGLMLQLDGASFDVYDPTLVTQRNTNAAFVMTVPTLDTDNQTVIITLTGNATDMDAIQVGDALVPRGWIGGSMIGIKKIAENAGSLYGIDAATYPLWKANTFNVGSVEATMLAITRAAGVQVQRSGRKGKVLKAFCSFPTFNDLSNNLAALRRFGDSMKTKVELGTMGKICFYGPGVAIEIEPSALIWNSELYMAEWDSFERVGATDLTFTLPGSSPESPKFFENVADAAAYEIRGYWRQLVRPKRPACLTQLTDIVNSTD